MGLTDREIVEPDLSITGGTWTVDSVIAGDSVSSVPDDVVATLRFSDDGRVEVATGCNRGGGRYAVEGDTLRFDDLILTEMACDGPAGAMESAVLAVREADSVSFAIDGSSLTLGAGSSGLVLRGP
jgi:heat shock protein HslJ